MPLTPTMYPPYFKIVSRSLVKQGRKRPLDTPKRMIERRERERKVEG